MIWYQYDTNMIWFVVVVHMMLGGDLPFMAMLITNVMVVAM